jgi:hypothetical protein
MSSHSLFVTWFRFLLLDVDICQYDHQTEAFPIRTVLEILLQNWGMMNDVLQSNQLF